jgi:hypothetical protein
MEASMSEDETSPKLPINVVRFGLGKEIQLYKDELVVTEQEEGQTICLSLHEIKRLTLIPGDPNPPKLILMADLDDNSTIMLAEGMTNARGFRAMIPQILELHPDVELDPPDMADQLWQALNNQRAWKLTCYGAILLICAFLYILYLIVVYFGWQHH